MSAPSLCFLGEHGQLCLELLLVFPYMVLGILWMLGAMVFGMGELWGGEGVLSGVVYLPCLSPM
jgi:hypothetical protein